ncbi:MAG: peptide-methionine (S)-S-oxide reductase [Candidatus Zambryskibacteria bacterium]|nr:peptide-methionine (S)-S-oxide reductase [Candidatus Zambryskibacteria bacterium]
MKNEVIVFGGGCFWCTEAVFKMLKGVSSVLPGYTGGSTVNPTYEQVCNGNTGHVECVKIEFNPEEVNYWDLLTVFFGSHDSTTLNRQGNDIGTQYRSAVFYTTEEQKRITNEFINEINGSNAEGSKVVTEVLPLGEFFVAESYHQDYYEKNQEAGYCQVIINPKLEKVQKNFANLLKDKIKLHG